MRGTATIAVIIPALNEEKAIGKVVSALPSWVDDIVVVDNGSIDATAEVAAASGARVIKEPHRGYGSACLAGIAALDDPDVVIFLDADFSDHPGETGILVDPILSGEADMVIGSRVLGHRERGALTVQARLGNWLACSLMRLFWGVTYTDLGPFRAISYRALKRLDMRDPDFGWTVEMQIKAACRGLRTKEVPVSYRRRIGESKISGTLSGAAAAGTKILSTIFASALRCRKSSSTADASGERLIIFTRYPEPGKTKTRLIPALGAQGAADLQRHMTFYVASNAREFARHQRVPVEVRFEGGGESLMRKWLGPGLEYCPQGEGGLGDRMARAFGESFRAGKEEVVIIGTDCPGITPEVMRRAFKSLGCNDIVLGPAKDGGYYLIGMRSSAGTRVLSKLFEGISWGTGEVLRKTLAAAEDAGLSSELLEPLDDVDRPEDLSVWEEPTRTPPPDECGELISIIVPALDESQSIAAALNSAKRGSNIELIVVEGGSDDDGGRVARSVGARVIRSSPGRAKQMNAGAAIANGDILLFLHADTRLAEGFDEEVRRILSQRAVSGGAFSLRLDHPSFGLRVTERLATLRSRLLQMPYGDQAIFVNSELFRRVGGFPDVPIMEDVEFVRRIRRAGRIVISSVSVVTSARRWLALGTYRATLINHIAIIGYNVGVSLSRIARWYYSIR